MGVSTNGILFYGFSLDEEDESCWHTEDEDDWEDVYASTQGVIRPTADYEDNKEVYSTYWRDVWAKAKEAKCEIGYHCSGEFPIPYVALSVSHKVAGRGDAVRIENLEIQEDWRETLLTFCEVMKIPWQEPAWYLVSYWG